MSDIQITEEPLEIFRMVLRSLESHRPPKAEQDVLQLIQKRYHLESAPSRWPDQLVKDNVSVDYARVSRLRSPHVRPGNFASHEDFSLGPQKAHCVHTEWASKRAFTG